MARFPMVNRAARTHEAATKPVEPAKITITLDDFAEQHGLSMKPPAKAVAVIEPKPTLTIHDGKVLVSSVNLASMFGKRHDNVLRDIDALIKETGILNFEEGSYTLASSHTQKHRCFEMDRDGPTLLAMGFTGPKALQFKIAYIAEFNRVEATLRAATPAPANLNDPATLRTLLVAQHLGINRQVPQITRHIIPVGRTFAG